MNGLYDVVVIGGGPAGAATATFLAQQGVRTLILEKARFPRFSVGESLMPETYWPLKRLGVLEAMQKSPFPKKYSVQFVTAEGREARPFYFYETNEHESSQTWQVLRETFDEMLLDNARAHGVDVCEETIVRDVLFEDGRAVGVRAVQRLGETETEFEVSARVVVDASGKTAFLGRKLGIIERDPGLNKMAIFAYYENGIRDEGIDAGVTRVVYVREHQGWFWYIPLPDNTVSVGVVAAPDFLYEGRERNPEAILNAEIALSPFIKKRLAPAKRISDVYAISDFSYRARQCAGDGWVLVGDAFGFLDPIYASGLFLALTSAEMAADTIVEALNADDTSRSRLERFGPRLVHGIEAMRKLIYAFYTPNFRFADFVRKHPEHRMHLIDLLIGRIYEGTADPIFDTIAHYCALPEPMPLDLASPTIAYTE
ncbi:hypothetical protein ARMA_1689 [Ardenticatena maritima]|uniref:FAD-binding domain-containing protein n=1 Tax=Ardenticatena maritima TaxID=872965 RepID=A0A0M8K9X6_9CHLR|nr:NAD(P)/FAD-dependent oxidoreductase [Ardenticatena maritima]KPL88304.1 hypothetical protein SE16_05585 [Ardenticatena maritima]GAP63266.1 hypothetical protein ARMA_1689 [Ardenticatena maritima]